MSENTEMLRARLAQLDEDEQAVPVPPEFEALAALAAANEAIETAGPLYQTRESLKDKIVCLIGQRSDLITQVLALRRESDATHARIRELEARAEQAERERDEARSQVAAVIEVLQLVSDALARLDQIYRADTDLGDPPMETPAWLREAQHRAAALLAPATPTPAPEAVEEMEVRDA